MNVLVIPDKFKGSLSAAEAAECIRAGLLAAHPDWHITTRPVADGGEGTAELLTRATNGTSRREIVADPLGRSITAQYGVSGDKKTAFIELADASGLYRLTESERNPLETSTFGTGQLIKAALSEGVQELVLCIGGSATNDAGIGLATALGYRFLTEAGQVLPPVGASLGQIAHIDDADVLPALGRVRVRVACDVANPLAGPAGAAYVYAPQKGANAAAVAELDAGLQTLANVVEQQWGRFVAQEPGSGAAGGAGYGARVFLNAHLEPGFALVAGYLNLNQLLANADLIITGEGKLDGQTLSGKVIRGVVERAGETAPHRPAPVVAFCGRLALSPKQVRVLGLRDAIAITPDEMPLAEAIRQAKTLLQTAVTRYFSA